MTMNLKKDFILTSFNHRLFTLPAFCGLFYQWFAKWRTFLLYKKTSGDSSPPKVPVNPVLNSRLIVPGPDA